MNESFLKSRHEDLPALIKQRNSFEHALNSQNITTMSGIEYKIVKRNGMFVPFSKERIFKAVEAAFNDKSSQHLSKGVLPQEFQDTITFITEQVVQKVLSEIDRGDIVSVERIQDIVEKKLIKDGFHDTARDYIVYREQRKSLRDVETAPITVIRRDGKVVRFNPIKISSAIQKAFLSTQNLTEKFAHSFDMEVINDLTSQIINNLVKTYETSTSIPLETIQDTVEKYLMMNGYYEVAKKYILYREERNKARLEKIIDKEDLETKFQLDESYTVFKSDASSYNLYKKDLLVKFLFVSKKFKNVDAHLLTDLAFANCYEGMKESEIDISCIMAARAGIEKEPEYAYVAAALLLDVLYRDVVGINIVDPRLEQSQREYFLKYIQHGIDLQRLSPELASYDLQCLANAMDFSRDSLFSYLGIQTLYDRYFIHCNQKRLETPQIFWMRVAMGLALGEGNKKTEKAIEFYNVLSQFLFMSATPTLFNSGTVFPQLSSCYLSTISDDLKHIYKVISDDALLSKWSGGLGNDWTNVRAIGAHIKGTNGKSQGVIPFIKVANDTALAVNQGGKRKGALCVYLELWHLDIEDFLELRKNTGDERRRTHDINTANWIPDLFFKRLLLNESWTLFSPNEVPELHSSYGKKFEELYLYYEKQAEEGKIELFRKIEANVLWRKMLGMLYETGQPWITFKDPSNIRSPQDHEGVIYSSNLCTEILLNTSEEETAVCNLGSLNLVAHIENGSINHEKIKKTIFTAIRMLDNVIDLNYYPIPETEKSNKRHRAIGLGLMGFQDALYRLNISYADHKAIEFADESMEIISYYAILASSQLAKERGTYLTYKGSKWDRGLLPIDTLDLLEKERGSEYVEFDKSSKLDWTSVRESIKNFGMRNSNVMALAPTATISNIVGITQSIEPVYKHLFVKSNLSGEFTIPNTYLIQRLKELNLWDEEMLDDLKYFDGSLMEISRVPEELKKVFLTAFEIEPEWLIECASRRQKWIDQGQSLNLYLAEPNGKKLSKMYLHAWKKGLKTTYYLRALGATSVEKSSADINKRGIQPRWMKNKSASSGIVVNRKSGTTMCSMEDGCESCQ